MFIFGFSMRKDINFKMSAKGRRKYFKNFMTKACLDIYQVMLSIPLPGTELRKRLKLENRIYSRQDLGWEYYDGNFLTFEPDDPMTPEEMQALPMDIMGGIYQFKYMFMIALNVFSFPYMIFSSITLNTAGKNGTGCGFNLLFVSVLGVP